MQKKDLKKIIKNGNIDISIRMKCIDGYFNQSKQEAENYTRIEKKEQRLFIVFILAFIIFIINMIALFQYQSINDKTYISLIILGIVSVVFSFMSYEKLFKNE